jgi:hypothetical protein
MVIELNSLIWTNAESSEFIYIRKKTFIGLIFVWIVKW